MGDKSSKSSSGVTRRQFLAGTVGAACAAGLAGLGLASYTRQAASLPAYAIRPPGALEENDFLGACVRCGLCVRNCPYDTLRLAQPGEDVALGTP
ncbi:MAG: 4Fe-4S binding protein, partial [Gammaproteobacteria bacterium]|nr:4Fe-4S binding protein [Gammaproteobacteria bacterium]